MRIFTAFLAAETNTFAAAPSGWGSFEEYGIFRGDASTRDIAGYGADAVVLEPESLREDVLARLRAHAGEQRS